MSALAKIPAVIPAGDAVEKSKAYFAKVKELTE
jgi:hypothetical protein